MIGQVISAGILALVSISFARLGSDQTIEPWENASEAKLGRRIFAGLAIIAAFGAGLLL